MFIHEIVSTSQTAKWAKVTMSIVGTENENTREATDVELISVVIRVVLLSGFGLPVVTTTGLGVDVVVVDVVVGVATHP